MNRIMTIAACAATIVLATPSGAQERAARLGPLWSVSMIDVKDGHFEEYMAWLNTTWRANQAFAKQQGWLLDYHILANQDNRVGEPDLYLITTYKDEPTAAELEKRDAVMLKRMQTTAVGADQQSASRGTMRTQMGSMTLREMLPRR